MGGTEDHFVKQKKSLIQANLACFSSITAGRGRTRWTMMEKKDV